MIIYATLLNLPSKMRWHNIFTALGYKDFVMLLTHRKNNPITVALNDLVLINNERITCYRQAILQTSNMDNDLKMLFENIIAEAGNFKAELIDKLKQLHANPRNNITISGLIHLAWQDLKVTLKGNSRDATISFCLYNEEVALKAYEAALNQLGNSIADITMIERQHALLCETYNLVKEKRQLLHYPSARLMYFN